MGDIRTIKHGTAGGQCVNEPALADHLRTTKDLQDVKADMSELYEHVKSGQIELKFAAELANITGKYLKAAQLEFAREVFLRNGGRIAS